MATNYPAALDNFQNPTGATAMSDVTTPHAGQHANANDAIEALEAKVGTGASPASGAPAGAVLTATSPGTTEWAAPAGRLGNTIVLLGDSFTGNNGGIPANPSYQARGFFTWAQVFLGHRFEMLANKGIGGQTSAQIAARVAADVVALAPAWCHYLAGTNDVDNGVTAAATIANDMLVINACRAAGIRVILGTIPHLAANTPAGKINVSTINAWRRKYARSHKNAEVILADYDAVLTDPATGNIRASFTFDTTHPSIPGAAAMGWHLAQILDPLVPYVDRLSSSINDTQNLLTNGTFEPGAALTTGWSSAGTATFSKVARSGAGEHLPGKWQRMVVPPGGAAFFQQNIALGAALAIGDVLIGLVEVRVSDLELAPAAAVPTQVSTKLQSYNGAGFTVPREDLFINPGAGWENFDYYGPDGTGWQGVLETPQFTVPADSTLAQFVIGVTGGGTYDFARATVLNLTKLAAATAPN